MTTPVLARQPGEQALIAEARARARRRRLRIALVVIAAAAVALAAVLAGQAPWGRGHAAAGPRAGAAIRTGVVTGYLSPCGGPAAAAKIGSPGTVLAFRGTLTRQRVAAGLGQLRQLNLPAKAVASEYVSNDYRQMFRFTLPPGRYVLLGFYDPGSGFTFRDVSVLAGKVVRADLPDLCV
jgi:hypothetical protein